MNVRCEESEMALVTEAIRMLRDSETIMRQAAG